MTIGSSSASSSASSPGPDRESRLHLLGIVAVTVAMVVGGFIVTIRRDDDPANSVATPVTVTATPPSTVTALPTP